MKHHTVTSQICRINHTCCNVIIHIIIRNLLLRVEGAGSCQCWAGGGAIEELVFGGRRDRRGY